MRSLLLGEVQPSVHNMYGVCVCRGSWFFQLPGFSGIRLTRWWDKKMLMEGITVPSLIQQHRSDRKKVEGIIMMSYSLWHLRVEDQWSVMHLSFYDLSHAFFQTPFFHHHHSNSGWMNVWNVMMNVLTNHVYVYVSCWSLLASSPSFQSIFQLLLNQYLLTVISLL